MTDLQELIETAERLSQRLEAASAQEKKFCVDICMKLEQMSWEIFRTANELNEIRQYLA